MKILFITRMLNNVSGGVERMAIALMNELCRRGHTIELLSWDKVNSDTWYPLDKRIKWHCLNMGDAKNKAGWILRTRRQLAIRRYVRNTNPDAMIAFQHGPFLTVAISTLGLGVPLIAAERNAPHRFDYLRSGGKRKLIFQTFRLADRVTVQIDDYIDVYPHYLRKRIVSIPNHVHVPEEYAKPSGDNQEIKQILSVGRLTYQKNQSVLIEAFSRIAPSVPDWNLILIGAGEDEQKLRNLVIEKKMSDRVTFKGAVKDVERFYLESHLFCLPSRWEGFPNAMAEAMAHGLPVIGYKDCAGVKQLIDNGITGCLSEGNGCVTSLSDDLYRLMTNSKLRQTMGEKAAKSMHRFTPADVYSRWESLFEELSRQS